MSAAIAYGLIAMFAGGIANALLKSAAERLDVLPAVIFRSGVSASTLAALALALRPAFVFSADMFLFALALSILGYFPFLFFVRGLSVGKVGVVSPIAAGWIIVAAAVGFVFLGEQIIFEKLFALALVVLGVFAVTMDPKEWGRAGALSVRGGVPFALAAALLWGVVFPLFQVPSSFFGALYFALLIESTVCLSGISHLLLTRARFPKREIIEKNWIPITIAGVLTAFFTFAVSEGCLTGEVSIVSALAGSAVVVAVLAAAAMYRERLSPLQYAGAGLVLFGTVFASFL